MWTCSQSQVAGMPGNQESMAFLVDRNQPLGTQACPKTLTQTTDYYIHGRSNAALRSFQRRPKTSNACNFLLKAVIRVRSFSLCRKFYQLFIDVRKNLFPTLMIGNKVVLAQKTLKNTRRAANSLFTLMTNVQSYWFDLSTSRFLQFIANFISFLMQLDGNTQR